MGVRRFEKLLRQEGWLPSTPPSSCTPDVWRTTMVLDAFGRHLERIPPRSTLHIDGAGLVFFLHQVAYSRHVQSIVGGCSAPQQQRQLRPDEVTKLLPGFMPLCQLTQVTHEFIADLLNNDMELIVYWDGPQIAHVFKAETIAARQGHLTQEWSNLHQYCAHGVLPPEKNRKRRDSSSGGPSQVYDWTQLFPMSRLAMQQVKHVLRVDYGASVHLVHCSREADHAMACAAAAAGDGEHFLVGRDTDFCFFSHSQYVPFETLSAGTKVVTACVLRRKALAEQLGLTQDGMVELALLLGNDYIDPSSDILNSVPKQLDQIVDMVRDNADFRVNGKDARAAKAVEFVRALYNLRDLSEYYVQNLYNESDSEVSDVFSEGKSRATRKTSKKDATSVMRPSVPSSISLKDVRLDPLQHQSVKDAVLHCLNQYVSQKANSAGAIITKRHVEVFASMPFGRDVPQRKSVTKVWHPLWPNVVAAYIIEKLISNSCEHADPSPAFRISRPGNVFVADEFHARLSVPELIVDGPAPESAARLKNGVHALENGSKSEEISRPEQTVLPIDEHEEKILQAVRQDRITIIQGETGCGKSSRIPIMLLRAPPPAGQTRVKLFISQPHRIAAKALVERVRSTEPEFGKLIALRMGHGVREYETSKTCAWFVTTGYLVRLLANYPDTFDDVSYLVIDEVHERSVDTDILCLLCRRLMKRNDCIRLVLMSATLAADLYQRYFDVARPVIRVGARRFSVQERFLEDIGSYDVGERERSNIQSLMTECDRLACKAPPPMSYMEKLHSVSARLAVVVGSPRSSVLIFVPGMNDIVAITDLIESSYKPGVRFTCYPVHSDIPFEDQMTVFKECESDEVKVVIATNAAESSVTLPDVDHVICLGLCKQIVYNPASHRQMLTPTWISKSSATQRAGRTGRLRPGTVYRLYTKSLFEEKLQQFEPGEMVRVPLDSVILMLKDMLPNEKVAELLKECLEPPDTMVVERSLESLHTSHFLASAEEDSDITTLGSFVLALGIDLSLGSLIGLGIQYGVGPETIELAAVLSFPKTPWIMSNPLIHSPEEFLSMTVRTFQSRLAYDAGLLSEPLSIMNLLWDFERASATQKWCRDKAVSLPRVKRLSSIIKNLKQRVSEFLGIRSDTLATIAPPQDMPPEKLAILRIIQVWVFSDSILEYKPVDALKNFNPDGVSVTVSSKSGSLDKNLFVQIFTDRYEFDMKQHSEIIQKGTFVSGGAHNFRLRDVHFEQRFLSYAVEKNISLIWVRDGKHMSAYVRAELYNLDGFCAMREKLGDCLKREHLRGRRSRRKRGVGERDCGRWAFVLETGENTNSAIESPLFVSLHMSKSTMKSNEFHLQAYVKANSNSACMSCNFSAPSTNDLDHIQFVLQLRGNCEVVSTAALSDLLGTSPSQLQFATNAKVTKYTLDFAFDDKAEKENETLFSCAPEPVQLLTMLASGRRRDHFVRLPTTDATGGVTSTYVDVIPDPDVTMLSKRWKRLGTDYTAFVPADSVSASVLPLNAAESTYCCCGNILELRGGLLRADNLTMLPSGRLFLVLARLAFGLIERNEMSTDELIEKALLWTKTGNRHYKDKQLPLDIELDWRNRILKALEVNERDFDLGETLACFPDRTRFLLEAFSGVEGRYLKGWEGLDCNPFTPTSLRRLRADNSYTSRGPSGLSEKTDEVAKDELAVASMTALLEGARAT